MDKRIEFSAAELRAIVHCVDIAIQCFLDRELNNDVEETALAETTSSLIELHTKVYNTFMPGTIETPAYKMLLA